MTDRETCSEPPATRHGPATTPRAVRTALMRYFYPPSLCFAPHSQRLLPACGDLLARRRRRPTAVRRRQSDQRPRARVYLQRGWAVGILGTDAPSVEVARVIRVGSAALCDRGPISTPVPLATVCSRKCSAISVVSSKAVAGTSTRSASFERPVSPWKASAVAPPSTIPPPRAQRSALRPGRRSWRRRDPGPSPGSNRTSRPDRCGRGARRW